MYNQHRVLVVNENMLSIMIKFLKNIFISFYSIAIHLNTIVLVLMLKDSITEIHSKKRLHMLNRLGTTALKS